MKKGLFPAALCIFLLPLLFGHSNGASSQFSADASGYLIIAGREPIPCECEFGLEGYDENCVCDGDVSAARASGNDAVNDSGKAPAGLGTEALFALAAIMLWLRFKP